MHVFNHGNNMTGIVHVVPLLQMPLDTLLVQRLCPLGQACRLEPLVQLTVTDLV